MLIRARCYLGFGFNIEQVKEILQKESIEKIDDLLSKQEEKWLKDWQDGKC